MKLQLKIAVVNGVETIVDVKAKIFGCGAAIASTSYLTERIKGRPVADAAHLTNKSIALALELPPVKIHCSVLAEEGLKAALNDYRRRTAGPPPP
jgi:nitrogen fixation NifU-like protein